MAQDRRVMTVTDVGHFLVAVTAGRTPWNDQGRLTGAAPCTRTDQRASAIISRGAQADLVLQPRGRNPTAASTANQWRA
jgi:hypothetical protein